MKWDKERRLEDMQRERVLLDHTRYNFDIKKKELLKFIAESSSYVTQVIKALVCILTNSVPIEVVIHFCI